MMAIDSNTLDILKEIGNIGSGNAASALASMLNDKVDIGLPSCEMLPFSSITRGFESPEEIVVGTLVQMSGDMEGFVMMIMTLDASLELLSQLTGEDYSTLDRNDYERVCEIMNPVSEIGNILIGSYLSAISAMTNMSIVPSVPALSVDMVMALMNLPAVVYGTVGEAVMYMETNFHNDQASVTGQYFLVPTVES
ncbi:chemotaxis protein CheC, partial [Christensenellaceae bacterium OttesenSCG-928-M15]|nr:chemotaxis protein CheC [Christensenellaceae bacterium OttesenSCG-928-M15]